MKIARGFPLKPSFSQISVTWLFQWYNFINGKESCLCCNNQSKTIPKSKISKSSSNSEKFVFFSKRENTSHTSNYFLSTQTVCNWISHLIISFVISPVVIDYLNSSQYFRVNYLAHNILEWILMFLNNMLCE